MQDKESDYRHIERTYDEGSPDYSDYFKLPHEFIEPERKQFIEALPQGSRILDCGCGPGMDSQRFAQLGYDVTAIDLSDRFVELTKRRAPGASVRKMDMRNLEFPPSSFEAIWASFSLLHVRAEETAQTLSGFKSVLTDGGLLFIALHRGATTAWVKTIISGMERDTYLQEWLQEDIETRVVASGFVILVSRPFERKGGRYPLLSILARNVTRTR